ncbi:hypothetical protein [Aquicella lusitana]|uniref:Uncharacterized protein n=1 Tax=Aquicella lusitana TaxID=254246 RepID=A0A370GH25_9COXI|nr:hypothetical protein [Aquicella lusitana]RDI42546.1 hypothetical protein C8D86_11415 [Aquicella lusitana]VVC74325.1 hypothetical protein AQULUS_20900 [Aquicella lusitana]
MAKQLERQEPEQQSTQKRPRPGDLSKDSHKPGRDNPKNPREDFPGKPPSK